MQVMVSSEVIIGHSELACALIAMSDEGALSVRLLGESGYEKRIGQAAAEAQELVPFHHRGS